MADAKLDTKIRREQIAEAALAIIGSQGLRRLSIANVAHRVGLVPSGIYRHFKNKDELLDAVLRRVEERLLVNVEASREAHQDPLACLKDIVVRHIRFLREGKVISVPRMIFSEDADAGGRKHRIHHVFKQYIGQVELVVAQGQKQGVIRSDVKPQTIALMLFGIVLPAGILWYLTDGGFDVTHHTQQAWRLFADAVAPQKTTDKPNKTTGKPKKANDKPTKTTDKRKTSKPSSRK
jgi:AcrR family transcriptional regulator